MLLVENIDGNEQPDPTHGQHSIPRSRPLYKYRPALVEPEIYATFGVKNLACQAAHLHPGRPILEAQEASLGIILGESVRHWSVQVIFGTPNAAGTARQVVRMGTDGTRNLGCSGFEVGDAATNDSNREFQGLEENREPQIIGHIRLRDPGKIDDTNDPKK